MRFLSPLLLLLGPNPSPSSCSLRRSLASIRRRLSSSAPDRVRKKLRSFSIPSANLGASGVVSVVMARPSYPPSRFPSMAAAAEAAAAEDSPARRFWILSHWDAVMASYIPFVVCVAAGNLKLESFVQCITQNVYFLKAFAQAYDKAEDYTDEDDAKPMIHKLRDKAIEEIKTHNSIVQKWGIDPTKEVSPSPATVKYTDFLLATAEGKIESVKGLGKIATPFEKTKITAYTVGAMAPCIRLFSFLGKDFKTYLKFFKGNHPYKEWIDYFSSDSFEETAIQVEELLDKLSVSFTGEELEIIQKLYHQAIQLLTGFFSVQPIVQPVVVPLIRTHHPANHFIIFSDFDLTCTTIDSCAVLAQIAIRTAAKANEKEADNQNASMSVLELRNLWDSLSRQYSEEYEQCVEDILMSERAMSFDYEGLCKALGQVSDFEKLANSRLIESGVLKGMNLDDIKRAGECLKFHEGCIEFFQKVVEKKEKMNIDLHFLSYCWSAHLISSAFSSGSLTSLNIHSNELEYEGSVSTGDIVRKIESSLHKIEAFKTILSNSGSDGKLLSVYIGDSIGDLPCLLEADVGIVVGSSASLRRVGTHFGVSFVPLSTGVVLKQMLVTGDNSSIWKGLSGVLYEVSSWLEIQAFILGKD